MEKEKNRWSNVVIYDPDDFLLPQEYAAFTDGVRHVWREMGKLHLRLANDVNIKSTSMLPASELRDRLEELQKKIDQLAQNYLGEG